MKKAFAVAIGLALAFGLVGCGDSNESKSEGAKSETLQGTKSENVQGAQSENSQNESPKAPTQDKISKGALEFAQNYPLFEKYQNTTFKQMLEKWTNMCASVSWEVESLRDGDKLYEEDFEPFSVSAYCEIKDFDTLKQKLQSYYTSGDYVDFSFDFVGKNDRGEPLYVRGEWSFISRGVDELLPGGKDLLKELNDNQNKRVFDYIMDTLHLPLSQAINQSEKIFLVFMPRVILYNTKEKEYKFCYGCGSLYNVVGVMRYDDERKKNYQKHFDTITLSFQIQGNKFYVPNPYSKIDRTSEMFKNAIDVAKAMFFNQNISPITLLEKNFILPKRVVDGDYGWLFNDVWIEGLCGDWVKTIANKKCTSLLAPPASKKILYREQEVKEYEKNLADFIVKVYSEPDVPSTQSSTQTSTSETAANAAQSVAQTAPSSASTSSSKTDSLPSLKLATKDEYVNLRKAPSGEVLTPIYKKDFDKITIKRLDGGDAKWLKVLYFPPNVSDESKALMGYIHISQIAK